MLNAHEKRIEGERGQGFVELAVGMVLLVTMLLGAFELGNRLYVLAKVREAARQAAAMVGRYDPTYLAAESLDPGAIITAAVKSELANLGDRITLGTVTYRCCSETSPVDWTSISVRIPCTVQPIVPLALLPGLNSPWKFTVEAAVPTPPKFWLFGCPPGASCKPAP